MKSEISATDAARRFSEVLNRVRYKNESFVVKRGGEPICEIVPARPATISGRELAELLRSLPRPDPEYSKVVSELIRNQPPIEKSRWPR